MKKLQTIAHTIPAALAMHAGQVESVRNVSDHGRSTGIELNTYLPQNSDAISDPPISSDGDGAVFSLSETITVTFAVDHETWGAKEQARFDVLVTKEATETISRSELEELDGLQILRRRMVLPPTAQEMVERSRRDKLDRELLKVLNRYVSIRPFGKDHS